MGEILGPEQRIQRQIVLHLRSMGAWVFKVHGSPYQRAGVPDLLVGYKGQLYALEVKRPGQRLSAIQTKIIEEIRASGCIAGRVESIEEAEEMVTR